MERVNISIHGKNSKSQIPEAYCSNNSSITLPSIKASSTRSHKPGNSIFSQNTYRIEEKFNMTKPIPAVSDKRNILSKMQLKIVEFQSPISKQTMRPRDMLPNKTKSRIGHSVTSFNKSPKKDIHMAKAILMLMKCNKDTNNKKKNLNNDISKNALFFSQDGKEISPYEIQKLVLDPLNIKSRQIENPFPNCITTCKNPMNISPYIKYFL